MSFLQTLCRLDYGEKDDLLDEISTGLEPPEEVEVFWRVACLRALCRLLHIRGISVKPGVSCVLPLLKMLLSIRLPDAAISEHQQQYEFQKRRAGPAYFPHSQIKTDSLTWLEKKSAAAGF